MVQDFTNWWITVWIGKPQVFKCQFLSVAERANRLKGKLFGAVTRLESSLTELSHPLDQRFQA
jgi:hypothetical protein